MRVIFNYGLIFIVALLLPALMAAQPARKLKIESGSMAFSLTGNNEGALRCYINRSLVQKGETQNIQFYLYAMNDAKNLPMLLTENGKAVPVKLLPMAANKPYNLIFTAPLDKLLFTRQGDNKYKWSWRGRAKAPVSPVMVTGGGTVKKVKCWFQATIDKQLYTSDTISIAINK